jgi:inorganic phosphate transporter, PiT family
MFDFFHSALDHFGTFDLAHLPLTVWLLILLALAFDFLNGLHDAANSIATVVSTRVLTPQAAVVWAAAFNFIAFVVFPLKVAETIQGDVIDQRVIDNEFLTATLIAACAWNVLTWYLGLPTSSSHALIGGMVGAAILTTGDFSALKWGLMWIVLFIVLAPLIGVLLGSSMAVAVAWLCRRQPPRRVDRFFRVGQFFSAAFFSLGHGGNDAQKTMGIIYLLLLTARPAMGMDPDVKPPLPTEVVLACHLAMGLGTLWGGWRIVKTMGQKIIHLRPVDGFCAETGAALTLALTTVLKGIPISTTHTITGAIVGVGTLRRRSAVRWGVAGNLVWAWVLTIPGAALVAALSLGLIRLVVPR